MIEIPGYNKYLINESGDIFSKHVNRKLTIAIPGNGYPMIRLSKDGKSKNIRLHRLLAFVFLDLDSLEDSREVHYKDGNILNYSLDNLQVVTFIEHREITTLYKPRYCSCGKNITQENVSGKCGTCKGDIIKNPEIKAEDIHYWVTNYSWRRAGQELGMTDNGLRHRFKKLTGLLPSQINSFMLG